MLLLLAAWVRLLDVAVACVEAADVDPDSSWDDANCGDYEDDVDDEDASCRSVVLDDYCCQVVT